MIFNIVYISSAVACGYFVDYRIFVALTSWVHYLKYIHQYYFRGATKNRARYDAWKRDVLLYKTIAISNLVYIYFFPYISSSASFSLDFISLAMISLGYFISISATNALGIEGTYFGIELGFVEADYNFVKSFPYSTIPHPMIVSQVFALLGFYKVPHVHSFSLLPGAAAGYRSGALTFIGPESGLDGWWWIIPIHILLYAIHCTQEIYDFWKGDPWYKVKKSEDINAYREM
mmetsp:Transcript_23110/g.35061  ORF Transcript_23110/g.35061 Transcript_23110/m.35061 type:complete len:232 (+) Transcript_23110:122-817(+)